MQGKTVQITIPTYDKIISTSFKAYSLFLQPLATLILLNFVPNNLKVIAFLLMIAQITTIAKAPEDRFSINSLVITNTIIILYMLFYPLIMVTFNPQALAIIK